MLRLALSNSSRPQLPPLVDARLLPYLSELLHPGADKNLIKFQLLVLYQNQTLDAPRLQNHLLSNLKDLYFKSKSPAWRALIIEQILMLVKFAGNCRELRYNIEKLLLTMYEYHQPEKIDQREFTQAKLDALTQDRLLQIAKVFEALALQSQCPLNPASILCLGNCYKMIAEFQQSDNAKIIFYTKAMYMGDTESALALAYFREKLADIDGAIACYMRASHSILSATNKNYKDTMLVILTNRIRNFEKKHILSVAQQALLLQAIWQNRKFFVENIRTIIKNKNYDRKAISLQHLMLMVQRCSDQLQAGFLLQAHDYFSGRHLLVELARENYFYAVSELASINKQNCQHGSALYLSAKALLLLEAPKKHLLANYGLSWPLIKNTKKQARRFIARIAYPGLRTEHKYKSVAQWYMTILMNTPQRQVYNPDSWLLQHPADFDTRRNVKQGIKQALGVNDAWIKQKKASAAVTVIPPFFKKPKQQNPESYDCGDLAAKNTPYFTMPS